MSGLDFSAQLVLTGSAGAGARDVVRGRYHVGAAVDDIVVFSCYLPPSLSVEQYAAAMDELRDDCARFPRADLLVAGDFNAKVAPWGSADTDRKGGILAEFATCLDFHIGNIGDSPTFQVGARSSVVDFTLTRLTGGRRVVDWTVDYAAYTGSDHYTLSYAIQNTG